MGANSVTGTGQGSAETPIRQFQELSKVLTLDDKVKFETEGQTHVIRSLDKFSTEERATGITYHDDRTIYQKTIVVESFTVAASYGRVPHGISNSFDLVESWGYVDGKYDCYANYVDGTNYYWWWTGGGSFPVVVTLLYVYN